MPFISRKIPYVSLLDEEGLALIEENADLRQRVSELDGELAAARSGVVQTQAIPVIFITARDSEHDEVEWLANDILHRRLVHSLRYGDFAVLMRSVTSASSAA